MRYGLSRRRARGAFKELRPSFRQRFVVIELDYLEPDAEAAVIATEAGLSRELATQLVAHATSMPQVSERAMTEAPSSRVPVMTATLIRLGLDLEEAVRVGLLGPLSAPMAIQQAVTEMLQAAGA